jgi:hypothetical protein
MLDTNAERAGIEERYETACNASSLKVESERGGAVDVLIASAWSGAGLGAALRRLHSQWVKVAPRRFTEEHVIQRAAELPKRRDKPDLKRARTDLLLAYRAAIREAAGKLRGREAIVEGLTEWAVLKGEDPDVVERALTYWLAPLCPVCDGHGKRKLPDAPVLGANCHHCNGAKTLPAPMGAGRVLGHIDYSLKAHLALAKRRLRKE